MLKPLRPFLPIALVLAAGAVGCDDATAPAAVGEVRGIVTVDGVGLPDVEVELSGVERREVATDPTGRFTFAEVRPGAYVVTIRGVPSDASFSATSRTAVIAREPGRQTQTVDFVGNYIRTSSISGRVTSRDRPLQNVTVRAEGPDTIVTSSGSDGRFGIAGIRRGAYRVAISGYPSSVIFPATEAEVEVEVGEVAVLDFTGDPELTATVVIGSLVRRLPSGETEPVDPANVHGRIEVRLDVDRGEDTPESVELFLGDEVVARQVFNPPAAAAAPQPSSFQLTLTVDTHEFDPVTGEVRFENGERLLGARLSTLEGGEGVWTSAVPITLRNRDTFTGRLLPQRGPVAGTDGKEWVGGDQTVEVLPVLYDPSRVVTSVTVELRRSGGAALRERASGGEAPFQVVFPGSGEPASTNVAGYQTPAGVTDQFRVRTARYGDGSVVDSPPAVVADEVRLDNRAPPGGEFRLPMQGAEHACCLNNWVGSGFEFASAFTGEPDEGVGGGWVTFHVGEAAKSDQEISQSSAVSKGEQVQASFSNSRYRAVAVYRDELDNRLLVPLEPSDGNPLSAPGGGVFGVDRTPPTVRFSAGSLPDRAVNPPAGGEWTVRAEDLHSGFSSTPARTTLRRLAPGIDGVAGCPFPGTPSCQPAPDPLSRALPDTGTGYFVYTTRVLDRAGNASEVITRSALRDAAAPQIEEIDRPASPLLGSTVLVRAPASDDVDLHRGVLSLRFAAQQGLPETHLPFGPADTVGHRFDGSPVGSASFSWQVPIVGAVERADAGAQGRAPSGVLRPLSGLRAEVSDAARNEAAMDAAVSPTIEDPPRSFSVATRGEDEGVRRWALEAGGGQVCAPRGGLPGGGSCTGAPSTLVLEAAAAGQGDAFPIPFQTVHFYAVIGGRARWLGRSEAGQLVVDGGGPEGRVWSWELEWSPEEDFPAGSVELFAVGVDDGGAALQSVNPVEVTVVGGS